MLGGEFGGEGVRLLVDQEVHPALAVDGDRARLVAQHRGKAHLAEVVVQFAAAAGRGGEFHELETIDAHRVLEGRDLHARIGCVRYGMGLGVHERLQQRCRTRGSRTRCGRKKDPRE
jgi:hypothetical protein